MPTIYLDLRTNYASVPAGALPIGLGSPALFSALQALPSGNPLLTLITVPLALITVPLALITVPLAARQAVWVALW